MIPFTCQSCQNTTTGTALPVVGGQEERLAGQSEWVIDLFYILIAMVVTRLTYICENSHRDTHYKE